MNIFVLHRIAKICAQMHCDIHVIKQILECAQMMVAALVANGHDPQEMPLSSTGRPYGVTHKHHPCTLWAGESNGNFKWLGELGLALCEEYEYRKKSSPNAKHPLVGGGKPHRCKAVIEQLIEMHEDKPFDKPDDMTPFAQAMPDEFRSDDAVYSYREYYKSKLFNFKEPRRPQWNKLRPAPEWWA